MAKKAGYTQVLWLDAVEQRFVEEVGTMNIFFVMDDTIITPPLGGSILPGITRDSVLTLAKHWGIPTAESLRSTCAVRSQLGRPDLPIGLSVIQAPVFHTYSVMNFLELQNPAGVPGLREIFEEDCQFAHLMTRKAAQVIRKRLHDMRIEWLAYLVD